MKYKVGDRVQVKNIPDLHRSGQVGEVVGHHTSVIDGNKFVLVLFCDSVYPAYYSEDVIEAREESAEQENAELLEDIAGHLGNELTRIYNAELSMTNTAARDTLNLAFIALHKAHCSVLKAMREEKAT